MSPSKKVAVIGGGIIGLSTAVRIIEVIPQVDVTVIAEKLTPYTTGDGSAGFWNPYLLGDVPYSVLRFWCEETFQFLLDIIKSPDASQYGVGLLPAYFISSQPMNKPDYTDVYLHYRDMTEKELSLFPPNYKYGTCAMTLYAECTKLLPMLTKRFTDRGGRIIQRRINNLAELSGKYDIVVNCPGVQAANLVSDSSVKPIRGQVMRVRAPWIKYAVSADDFYILPNSTEVICGGTHQDGDWNTQVDAEDRRRIWEGCTDLIPSLKNAKVLREWVGLRPGRPCPRLENEVIYTKNGPLEVIHNYGHGGSGVTLFWGCAIQAANLLQETLNRKYGNRSRL